MASMNSQYSAARSDARA